MAKIKEVAKGKTLDLPKCPSGIQELDEITFDGLPKETR